MNFPERKRSSSSDEQFSKKQQTNVHDIEEVRNIKLVGQTNLMFKVKWKGYSENFNSWEPTKNVVKCKKLYDFIDEKYATLEKKIVFEMIYTRCKIVSRIQATQDQVKAITLHKILPFDPFEFKITQVAHQMLPVNAKFQKLYEDLVYQHYFFEEFIRQHKRHDKLLEMIADKEDFRVKIENELDFEHPPKFTYVSKNILADEVCKVVTTNAIKGCQCKTCSNDVKCCPKLMRKQFVYKLDDFGRSVPRLSKPVKIFECGDLCECDLECMNRVTQQPKTIPLCLFKTKDRGWGIKALSLIPKGAFILEYVGEMIGQTDADSRTETTYLFDLNPDGKKRGYYTIDAFKYGNLSRFINHSCDPNSYIWFVNTCDGRAGNQRLW